MKSIRVRAPLPAADNKIKPVSDGGNGRKIALRPEFAPGVDFLGAISGQAGDGTVFQNYVQYAVVLIVHAVHRLVDYIVGHQRQILGLIGLFNVRIQKFAQLAAVLRNKGRGAVNILRRQRIFGIAADVGLAVKPDAGRRQRFARHHPFGAGSKNQQVSG